MKKIVCFLIIAGMLPSMCGCGSIYSNYREVEQMLVIQSMGLDYIPSGVQVTLASAGTTPEDKPTCLSGVGDSVSTALERIRNYSSEEDLFFAHIGNVILGEEAAKRGIDSYLSYICRSPDIIIDMPMYVIKGVSAKELMSGAGSGEAGISKILQAVQANLGQRGDGHVFTALEITKNLARSGSALICALEYGTAAENAGNQATEDEADNASQEAMIPVLGQQEKTAAAAGYAIIDGEKLRGYIGLGDAPAVGLLMNKTGIFNIVVTDQAGAPVTLQVDNGSSSITPLWAEDGSLMGIDVSVTVSASVLEMNIGGDLKKGEYADQLTSQLEAAISGKVGSVLQTSRKLRADFLGIGAQVERASPIEYHNMAVSFLERLPELELRVSVSGELSHTNDIKDA